MRSPTATRRRWRDGRAVHPARRRRGRRARGRADRGPARAEEHLPGTRHALDRAGRRGVPAPAPARAGREGRQRAVRDHSLRSAGHRPQGRSRGGKEAVMTLWWILDLVLLLVVVPVVVILLNGVLKEAKGIVPSVKRISAAAAAGSKDLDAVPLLLTT